MSKKFVEQQLPIGKSCAGQSSVDQPTRLVLTINYIIEEFLLLPAAALKNQSKQNRQRLQSPRLRKLCSLFSVVGEIILTQNESQSCLIYHVIHTVRQLARLMCTPNLHQINITDNTLFTGAFCGTFTVRSISNAKQKLY